MDSARARNGELVMDITHTLDMIVVHNSIGLAYRITCSEVPDASGTTPGRLWKDFWKLLGRFWGASGILWDVSGMLSSVSSVSSVSSASSASSVSSVSLVSALIMAGLAGS